MHLKRRVVWCVVVVVAVGVVGFVWSLSGPTPLTAAYERIRLGDSEAAVERLVPRMPDEDTKADDLVAICWEGDVKGQARSVHLTGDNVHAYPNDLFLSRLCGIGLHRGPSRVRAEEVGEGDIRATVYKDAAGRVVGRRRCWECDTDKLEVLFDGENRVVEKSCFSYRRKWPWEVIRTAITDHWPF